MQYESAVLEETVVQSIETIWARFAQHQADTYNSIQTHWTDLSKQMADLKPNKEWINFAAGTNCLLDPDTPLRSVDKIVYPGQDDPCGFVVHQGWLRSGKPSTLKKDAEEGFFLLNPSGFLHRFSDSDPETLATKTPTMSLFLPEFTLGPPSETTANRHSFDLIFSPSSKGPGDRRNSVQSAIPAALSLRRPSLSDTNRSILSGGRTSLLDRKMKKATITVIARSHYEMREWWNEIKQLSRVYLIRSTPGGLSTVSPLDWSVSDPKDRSGPVAKMVRSAGYVKE